ncbi:hypothetical protein RUM44_004514 [Polyplax serrata]|uniref:Uncharacterized protein n=1 Tax=Polyplax serrata TaxID=468196 RepID=A0ABR1B342_POLSC
MASALKENEKTSSKENKNTHSKEIKNTNTKENKNTNSKENRCTHSQETKNTICKENKNANSKENKNTTCKKKPEAICNTKLQKLEERDEAFGEYCDQIEALKLKIANFKEAGKLGKAVKCDICRNPLTRKMISEPLVFGKLKHKRRNHDYPGEVQNDVSQLSDNCLKTSADLSNDLKNNLKNYSHTQDIENHSTKVQKAFRRARSLTLFKTTDGISGSNKVFGSRERIKLENAADSKKAAKANSGKIDSCQKVRKEFSDSVNFMNDINGKSIKIKHIDGNGVPRVTIPLLKEDLNTPSPPTEDIESKNESNEIDSWARELHKNSKSVTNLKNKVFELQKTCNEYSLKCNDIQLRLVSFSKKIQWDRILLRKIDAIDCSKSDEDIVQNHGKQMEFRLRELDQELDMLVKLNCVLLQQKLLLDNYIGEDYGSHGEELPVDSRVIAMKKLEKQHHTAEKIVNEKQNAINQLKEILDVMKNQENFSLKQKYLMESKMKELRKL